MAEELVAVMLDEVLLTVDEFAVSCAVSREWVIERVRSGLLLEATDAQPEQWSFSSRDLRRARRMIDVERKFEANPELAGLVADLLDEVEALRAQVRRFKLPH
jgi:chaperone modulatory protein CbpM